MIDLQLMAEEVAVVGLQINFYRKMVADLKSLKCHQKNRIKVEVRSENELEGGVSFERFTSASVRWKCSLKLKGWAEAGTTLETTSRPCTMILFQNEEAL